MSAAPSLRDYFVLEARHAPRRAPLAVALGGAAAVILSHLILPAMPAQAISFMEQAFRVEGLAAALVLNDLVAVYFAAFFVGAAGLLDAIVATREEHRLEILLTKPIRASTFLTARTLPVLGSSVVVGALVSLVMAIALVPHLDASASVSVAGALGGGLFLSALALVELAALEIVLVRMRDGFHGLLIAALVWMVAMIPVGTLMYRPDLFEGRDALANVICFASLVWHDATSAWLGPIALVAAVPIAALLIRVAAARLERTDSL